MTFPHLAARDLDAEAATVYALATDKARALLEWYWALFAEELELRKHSLATLLEGIPTITCPACDGRGWWRTSDVFAVNEKEDRQFECNLCQGAGRLGLERCPYDENMVRCNWGAKDSSGDSLGRSGPG